VHPHGENCKILGALFREVNCKCTSPESEKSNFYNFFIRWGAGVGVNG